MARIDLVAPVDVTGAEKLCGSRAHQLSLVRRRVRAKQRVRGEVVGVALAAALMVLGNQEVIKALGGRDDGVKRVLALKRGIARGEVRLNLPLDDLQRVVGEEMEVPANEVGDVGSDVVEFVVGEEPLGPVNLLCRRALWAVFEQSSQSGACMHTRMRVSMCMCELTLVCDAWDEQGLLTRRQCGRGGKRRRRAWPRDS